MTDYLRDDKDWDHAFWSLASFWAHAKGGDAAHEAASKMEAYISAALADAYAEGRKDEAEEQSFNAAIKRGLA